MGVTLRKAAMSVITRMTTLMQDRAEGAAVQDFSPYAGSR